MKNYFVLNMDGDILLKSQKAEEILDWIADPRVGLIWLTGTYVRDSKCYYKHPDFRGSVNVCFTAL